MKLYHKIKPLFTFNQERKGFNFGEFKDETVEALKNFQWIFTEKVDGTNLRIYWDGHTLNYGGRTDKAQFSKPQKEFLDSIINEDLERCMEDKFGEKEVYLFGEFFGGNIQAVGKDYSENYQIKIFDVMINNIWLLRFDAAEVAEGLGFEFVPIVLIGTIGNALNYVSIQEKSTFSNAPLEGLVGTPELGLLDRRGERIIVKIKKRDAGVKVMAHYLDASKMLSFDMKLGEKNET